jgi:hypothetical protein
MQAMSPLKDPVPGSKQWLCLYLWHIGNQLPVQGGRRFAGFGVAGSANRRQEIGNVLRILAF